MNTERRGQDPSEDHDAVVTYTRIQPQNEPVRSGRPGAAAGGRRGTAMDAAELRPVAPTVGDPLIGDARRDGDLTGTGALGGQRADRAHNVADFVEDANRPDWLRYGLIGAALAIVAGAGILAATVGVATISPATRQDGAPSTAANGEGPASAPASVAIREIPMSAKTAPQLALPVVAAPPVAVAPPIPRARPEDIASAPAAAAQPANPLAASVVPTLPPPASSASSAPPEIVRIESPPTAKPTPALVAPILPAPAPKVAVAPEDGGSATDGLIVSIEEALAKVDASAAAAPNGAASGTALPPVLPPPQTAAPQQSYPPYGSNAGPYYDVLPPPPAAGNGYSDGVYSNGPVPPEPVPQSYPQGAYPQGAYPQTPGIYQPDPYAYPPVDAEEAEVHRPGIVRRTIAKASDAVGRVFSKD